MTNLTEVKEGKTDLPQWHGRRHAAHLTARTTEVTMKYDGMESNSRSKDLKYACSVTITIKAPASLRSRGS
ncbi:hypothetical protein BHM03_00029211 [Ensete ventricosum]|nr:hypothetical protein BHM03_00029211 [Ensete ventricosum]